MSKAKFTKGQWRREQDTTLVWGACDPDVPSTYGMGVPIIDCKVRHWAKSDRHVVSEDESIANANAVAAIPLMYEALEAHRAWAYAEEHAIGSFYQRTDLCAHASSLTLQALAAANGQELPEYLGSKRLIVWPRVELNETDIASARVLVAAVLEHEQQALAQVEGDAA